LQAASANTSDHNRPLPADGNAPRPVLPHPFACRQPGAAAHSAADRQRCVRRWSILPATDRRRTRLPADSRARQGAPRPVYRGWRHVPPPARCYARAKFPSRGTAASVCLPTAGRAKARPGPFTGDGGCAATRAQLRAIRLKKVLRRPRARAEALRRLRSGLRRCRKPSKRAVRALY